MNLSVESEVSRELNVTIYLPKQFTKNHSFTYGVKSVKASE